MFCSGNGVNLTKTQTVTINGADYECQDCRILHVDIPARKSRLQPDSHRRSSERWDPSASFADNVEILVLTLTNGKYLYVTTDWAAYLLDKAMEHGAAFRSHKEWPQVFAHDKRCVEFYRTCKSAFLYGENKDNLGKTSLESHTRHFRMPYIRFKGKRPADVEGIELVNSHRDIKEIEIQLHARDLFDPRDDTGGHYHFRFGDVLGISRPGYHHFGVYAGDDDVIHFSGETGDFGGRNTIHQAPLSAFSSDIAAIEAAEFTRKPGLPSYHTADGRGSNKSAMEEVLNLAAKAWGDGSRGTSLQRALPPGSASAWTSVMFDLVRDANYHRYNPGQTVARAKSRITGSNYALPFNNCEHLAIRDAQENPSAC